MVGSGGPLTCWKHHSGLCCTSERGAPVNLTHVARSVANDALNTIFKLTFTGQRKAAYGGNSFPNAGTFHRQPGISTRGTGTAPTSQRLHNINTHRPARCLMSSQRCRHYLWRQVLWYSRARVIKTARGDFVFPVSSG